MSTPLHFRCPPDVYQALEAQAKAGGSDRTAAIIKALRIGLGLEAGPGEAPRLSGRVDQLEAQVAAVIAQVAALQQAPSQPTVAAPKASGSHEQLSLLPAGDDQAHDRQLSPGEWLSRPDAFRALGGNPDDKASRVASVDGKRSIGYQTFRLPKTNPQLPAYGLEFSPERHGSGLPSVRLIATKRNPEG